MGVPQIIHVIGPMLVLKPRMTWESSIFKNPPDRKVALVRDSLLLLNRRLGAQMTRGTACEADSRSWHIMTLRAQGSYLAKDI